MKPACGNRQPYTTILGALIIFMIKSQEWTAPREELEHVSSLKWATDNKFVLLREFGESDLWRNVTQTTWKYLCVRPILHDRQLDIMVFGRWLNRQLWNKNGREPGATRQMINYFSPNDFRQLVWGGSIEKKHYYNYHSCQVGSFCPLLPLLAPGNLKQNVLAIPECG